LKKRQTTTKGKESKTVTAGQLDCSTSSLCSPDDACLRVDEDLSKKRNETNQKKGVCMHLDR
jgi:hypothetical protein